jgi:hypothetical protein
LMVNSKHKVKRRGKIIPERLLEQATGMAIG